MGYIIKVNYRVKGNNRANILCLKPDEPINFNWSSSFNWIGNVNIEGETIMIIIHQESINKDPEIEDINLDDRIIIAKQEILDKIEEILNRKMN